MHHCYNIYSNTKYKVFIVKLLFYKSVKTTNLSCFPVLYEQNSCHWILTTSLGSTLEATEIKT